MKKPTAPSDSKMEEIIAALHAILWAILWANDAPRWVLVIIGVKVAFDYGCALFLAVREMIREEDDE